MKRPHHAERFSAFIQNELALFLHEALPFKEGVFITLMRVEPAPSGGSVGAWVSVWPDEARGRVAKQLKLLENKAKTFLAGRLNRKYAITVHFYVIEAT